VDSILKGYHRYTCGVIRPDKAEQLVWKLHERHAIGATVAQRITRKSHGKAANRRGSFLRSAPVLRRRF
jgi:hypothetical protein